jgi:hypothetical protein
MILTHANHGFMSACRSRSENKRCASLMPSGSTTLKNAVGVGLLIWDMVRARRPGLRAPKPSAPRGIGLISLAGVGVLFALAAIADPTFVSLVVIAGRSDLLWSIVGAHSTWTLVSHAPLILVLAFALSGENERVVTWVRAWWATLDPWMVRLATIAAFVVGTFFLLDALWFYATGELLLPT